MKFLRTWWGGALFGAVLGAILVFVVSFGMSSVELERQRATLHTLEEQLRQQESRLAQTQQDLDQQAVALMARLERARGLADQVVKTQGTSVERLKKVVAVLEALRTELNSP